MLVLYSICRTYSCRIYVDSRFYRLYVGYSTVLWFDVLDWKWSLPSLLYLKITILFLWNTHTLTILKIQILYSYIIANLMTAGNDKKELRKGERFVVTVQEVLHNTLMVFLEYRKVKFCGVLLNTSNRYVLFPHNICRDLWLGVISQARALRNSGEARRVLLPISWDRSSENSRSRERGIGKDQRLVSAKLSGTDPNPYDVRTKIALAPG